MKNLMSTNIYDVTDEILICGKCVEQVQPDGYKKLLDMYPNIYGVCLEETHMNMIVSKITAMISTGKVKKIILVTVDGSPHCVQLHYIKKEILRRITNFDYQIINYVIVDNNLIEIDSDIISLSKNLSNLQGKIKI